MSDEALRNPQHEPDDFEAASEATRDIGDMIPPKYQRKTTSKKWIIIPLSLLVIAGLGAGVYAMFLRQKSKETASVPQTQSTPEPLQPTKTIPSAPPKHYLSSQFSLSLDYPENWQLTDVEDSGRLVLRSPTVKLKDAEGQPTDSQIVITVRDKQQKLTEFNAGNAVAVLASEKITYTAPSQSQRAQTYLSFLHYGDSLATTIDGVYITGDTGYKVGQAIPKADISPIDPVVSVTFVKCMDTNCSGNEALSVDNSMWNDKTFADPIKTILTSLSIS